MNLKDMTNKDFKEYCENEGINVDSKNVSKPTRKEYLSAIKNFENKQSNEIDELLNISEPETLQKEISSIPIEDRIKAKNNKKLTRAEKKKEQKKRVMAKKRVIITSNSDNQTKVKNSMFWITWGNRLVGHQTDRIILDKPWHVREGALENLRIAMTTESIQDDEGNKVDTMPKQSYIIQELTPLTEDERNVIGKRQIIRDSSIDSLI